MLYGPRPTKPLHDMTTAPAEVKPLVRKLCWDITGTEGRKRLRKALGPEHEKSDMDIPGMRGFPVWRFVVRDGDVVSAPKDLEADDLPTVYILGPTAKKFMSVEATLETTGAQSAQILSYVLDKLDISV